MGATLNNKPSLVRLGAFAAVLLLTSGLLVTLFNEAQAANVVVEDIGSPSASSSSHTVHVDIVVPDGQLIPLVGISSVIETRNSETSKSSDSVTLVARDRCSSPFTGCTSSAITHVGGTTQNVLTGVQFVGAFTTSASNSYRGYGYLNDEGLLTSVDDGYTQQGTFDFTHREGYGYHPTLGYGYGHLGSGVSDGSGTGYGYGYSGSDLILRFQFTINPSQLGSGNYWFTALAETGSSATNDLSSAAQAFTVSSSSAGPGPGGGSDSGDSDSDSSTTVTTTASSITPPTGATDAYQSTGVTGESGNKVIVNTNDAKVPKIELTLDGDASDATIDIVIWPADTPPEGTPTPSSRTAFIVQVTISSQGEDHDVEIFVEIDADDLQEGDLSRAFGAKHVNPWVPQSKVDLSLNESSSKYTGSFSAKCCSVFMVGFDEEDPTISLSADADTADRGDTVTFTADAEDETTSVDRVEFYLGDQLVHTADSEPFTWEWATADADLDTHTVRAVAYDMVGNEAEDSQSIEVQQTTVGGDDDEDGGGTTGGGGGGLSAGTIFLIIAILAVIAIAVAYFMNQKKK